MGLSALTAFEIVGNADDLSLSIFEKAGKFGFLINRGPGHNFKQMLDAQPVFESREKAAEYIGMILVTSRDFVDTIPQGDDHRLSDKVIAKIKEDLIAHGIAQTYKESQETEVSP